MCDILIMFKLLTNKTDFKNLQFMSNFVKAVNVNINLYSA